MCSKKMADFHQPITEVPKYIRQFFRPSGRRVAETLSRVMTCRLDTYMALGGILTIPALCGVPVNFSKKYFSNRKTKQVVPHHPFIKLKCKKSGLTQGAAVVHHNQMVCRPPTPSAHLPSLLPLDRARSTRRWSGEFR